MKIFCFLVLLLIAIAVDAQDCGGVNAGGTCVPPDVAMPGYQPQPQAPQSPPQIWIDHWGALSTDTPKGILGSSTNAINQESAEQAALADCRSKGGKQCVLQISFRNGCAAMVLGNKTFNTKSAATLDEAIQKGMSMCSSGDGNCHVYYSTCSLPTSIQ